MRIEFTLPTVADADDAERQARKVLRTFAGSEFIVESMRVDAEVSVWLATGDGTEALPVQWEASVKAALVRKGRT